jgi:hypothetical protein
MKTYIIGYDLNRPGQDYTDLIAAIKTYGTRWHHLDSTWIIQTNETAQQVRDKLTPHIDNTDELLVVGSSGEGAWTGFNDKGSAWLKDNL